VAAEELKKVLPKWSTLRWQATKVSEHRGLFADHDEYKVRLLIADDSPRSDEEIIQEFRDFMSATQTA
jgi:hypothetical protein